MRKKTLVIGLIAVLAVGGCIGLKELRGLKRKWRLEQDGIWVARYLKNDSLEKPTELVDRIAREEQVFLLSQEWQRPSSSFLIRVDPSFAFCNTNILDGRALVVTTNRGLVWVAVKKK